MGALRPPAAPRRFHERAGWRAAAYAALDFETTGLDYVNDQVVSYGVVPVLGGRARIEGSLHQLIHPLVPPSPRSQTVHLLRPKDLAEAPQMDEARRGLGAALEGRYVLAWFADVEVNFLRRIFGGSDHAWRRRTIDVRNVAIAVDRKPIRVRAERGYSLASIAHRYGVPVAAPHEAYDDALVTAQLFLILASKLPDLPEPAVRDLLLAAGGPLHRRRPT